MVRIGFLHYESWIVSGDSVQSEFGSSLSCMVTAESMVASEAALYVDCMSVWMLKRSRESAQPCMLWHDLWSNALVSF